MKRFLYNLKGMQVIPFKISIIVLAEHSVTQIALVAHGSENATCKWQIAVSGDPNHQIVQESGQMAVCEVRLMSMPGNVRVTYLKGEKLFRKEYSLTHQLIRKEPLIVKGKITVNIPLSLDFSNDVKITGILSCRVEKKALKSLNTDEVDLKVLPGNLPLDNGQPVEDSRLQKMKEMLQNQSPEEYAATVLEVREPIKEQPASESSKPMENPETMATMIASPTIDMDPVKPVISRAKNKISPQVPEKPSSPSPPEKPKVKEPPAEVPRELPDKVSVLNKIEPMQMVLLGMGILLLICMFSMFYMMNKMASLESQIQDSPEQAK